jgi:hypothetical protein
MAQVQFVLNSGAEVEGVIQGDPGHVATQVSEAMTGSRPLIVYGLPEFEASSINLVNPASIAAVRVIEGEAIPAR